MESLWDRLQGQVSLVNLRSAEYAESLLRRSVASHLTLQYVGGSMHSHLKGFVWRLSDTDPDTACAILRALPVSILSKGCKYQGLTLLYDILQYNVYAKVRAVATEAYLYILDNSENVKGSREPSMETEPSKSALSSLVEWTPKDTTTEPGAVNLHLRMRGYHLFAICCNSLSIPEEVEVKLAGWSQMLRIAGNARSVCSPQSLHPEGCILILARISRRATPLYVR